MSIFKSEFSLTEDKRAKTKDQRQKIKDQRAKTKGDRPELIDWHSTYSVVLFYTKANCSDYEPVNFYNSLCQN